MSLKTQVGFKASGVAIPRYQLGGVNNNSFNMPKRNNNKTKKQNGQLVRIQGQGGYYTDKVVPFMRQIVPEGTFRRAGGAAGALLGTRGGKPGVMAGTGIGTLLGGKLSQILGFGDYEVRSNTIAKQGYAVNEGESVPSFKMNGRETRVCHREYIGDILVPASPTTFTNTSYAINASNNSLFPWLASTAANYQQYKFNGLVFEYKTLSSDITAGGALGAVILATNYDANDVTFANKLAMENSEYAVSAKPSRTQLHAIECDPDETANKLYYCRDSSRNTSATSDNRFYDLGNFQIATAGLPGTTGQVLGELWVTYDVSLYKPELAATGALTGKIVGATGVAKTGVFGTSPTVSGSLFTASATTLTFINAGKYVLNLSYTGTGLVTPTYTGTATVVTSSFAANSAGTNALGYLVLSVTAPQQTIIYDGTGSTTVTANTSVSVTSTDGVNI